MSSWDSCEHVYCATETTEITEKEHFLSVVSVVSVAQLFCSLL
jgi:hypothetical protein